MSQMPIAEQHRIVHELVERYKFQTEAVYQYSKVFSQGSIIITTEDHYSPVAHGTYFRIEILIDKMFNSIWFKKSIQELQETCFQDLLNPTENELTLFELQYGFKWPLQLCCEPIAHGLNPQPLTGDMNEIT